MQFPSDYEFAFTIIDDTDDARLENIAPIYDLLTELNFRTTKTVWPLSYDGESIYWNAHTLEDRDYTEYIKSLQNRGFEITWHGARMESSVRDVVEEALRVFQREFGKPPHMHINHGRNKDNLHWGYERLDNVLLRWLYKVSGVAERSYGHEKDSPYYWADHAKSDIAYCRNFTYHTLNVLRLNPSMPYHDARRRSVPYWFSASDVGTVHEFRNRMTKKAIDRLRRQRGVCILSTHLGKGFCSAGSVDTGVEEILRYLAELPGWFVPANKILDHLRLENNGTLPWLERTTMEFWWVFERVAEYIRNRLNSGKYRR